MKTRGTSAFIVEKGMPGWDLARRIELMASHDIVEFSFKDLKVPKENLLGVWGDGFKLAMQTLDLMRMSVGMARAVRPYGPEAGLVALQRF